MRKFESQGEICFILISYFVLVSDNVDTAIAILKPLSSAISIGTGGPFGAEGPIIMTGGAFGSLFAQFFKLSAAERKTLLVAGAAGGMSAVFASPIAAILLSVELLLFEWRPRSFVPVAVSAIVANEVRIPLLGAGPTRTWNYRRFRFGASDIDGLRIRRSLSKAADSLDVVADDRDGRYRTPCFQESRMVVFARVGDPTLWTTIGMAAME